MNYRHAFHAGNFADVVKHVALVALLEHLTRKDQGICIIDSHAGTGLYHLAGGEALRTGEAQFGIARLAPLAKAKTLPSALVLYSEIVAHEGPDYYPGSSRIAARLLRAQDRLIAIEKHPEEATRLRQSLASFGNARVEEADAYARLPALLPPQERRGLVLIDPPYEAADEFTRLAELLARAQRRFATGIYLVWYPIKSRAEADAFVGEVRTQIPASFTKIEVDVGSASEANKKGLSAAGLLVTNPPFGFDDKMKQCAEVLAPLLARDGAPATRIAITPPSR